MCGLAGVLRGGKLDYDSDYSSFAAAALYANALRGFHSTGLFTVDGQHKSYYMKDAIESRLFLGQSKTEKFVRDTASGTRVIACHNRHATMGGRGYDGAHPHTAENVVLIHNGTLDDYKWMPEHPRGDSDSARLTMALSACEPGGIEVLMKVRGAYALVWYDVRTKSIYIARNHARPLDFIIHEDDLFWASEGEMLTWLLTRKSRTKPDLEIRSYPTNVLHTYSLENLDVSKPVLTPYEPPAPIVYKQPARTSGVVHSAPESKPAFSLNSKRAKKVNNMLALRGVKAKVGDIVELMVGNFQPYSGRSGTGMVQGWADDVSGDLTMDKFKGQLWADVHGVNEYEKKGIMRDTIKARIKSIKAADNKEDMILLCEFVEHGMYREEHIWTDEALGKYFEGERWRYNRQDFANNQFGKLKLTNRELDAVTERMHCAVCSIPGHLVPTNQIVLTDDLEEFICLDCVEGRNNVVAH